MVRAWPSGIISRAVLAKTLAGVKYGLADVSVDRVRLSSSDSSESGISVSSPACLAMSGLLGSRKPIKTASPKVDWYFLRRRRCLGERSSEAAGLDGLSRLTFDDACCCWCLSCRNGGIDTSGPYFITDGVRPGERFTASSESYTSENMNAIWWCPPWATV